MISEECDGLVRALNLWDRYGGSSTTESVIEDANRLAEAVRSYLAGMAISRAATEAEPSGAFTPGPWMAHDHNGPYRFEDPAAFHGYAWVGYGGDRDGIFQGVIARLDRRKDGSPEFRERAQHDALLIAAAPDLLEALHCALLILSPEVSPNVVAMGRAVIAKALGREAASPEGGPSGELEEPKPSPLTTSTHPRIEGEGSSVADIARTGPEARPETNSLPDGKVA